jgi:hypothetical protein
MFRRLVKRLKNGKNKEREENEEIEDNLDDLEDVNLNIKRKVFDYSRFTQNYPTDEFEGFGILSSLSEFYHKNLRPSKTCMKNALYKRVPVIKWIQQYKIKEYLLADFLSGLTVILYN